MATQGGGWLVAPPKPVIRPPHWTDDQFRLVMHHRLGVSLAIWGAMGEWESGRADMAWGRPDIPVKGACCRRTWFELGPSKGRRRPWLSAEWAPDKYGNEGLFLKLQCKCPAPAVIINMPELLEVAKVDANESGRLPKRIFIGLDGRVAQIDRA